MRAVPWRRTLGHVRGFAGRWDRLGSTPGESSAGRRTAAAGGARPRRDVTNDSGPLVCSSDRARASASHQEGRGNPVTRSIVVVLLLASMLSQLPVQSASAEGQVLLWDAGGTTFARFGPDEPI